VLVFELFSTTKQEQVGRKVLVFNLLKKLSPKQSHNYVKSKARGLQIPRCRLIPEPWERQHEEMSHECPRGGKRRALLELMIHKVKHVSNCVRIKAQEKIYLNHFDWKVFIRDLYQTQRNVSWQQSGHKLITIYSLCSFQLSHRRSTTVSLEKLFQNNIMLVPFGTLNSLLSKFSSI